MAIINILKFILNNIPASTKQQTKVNKIEPIAQKPTKAYVVSDKLVIDANLFYKAFRKIFGQLNQNQVNSLNYILASLSKYDKNYLTTNQIAYLLATIKHETAHTFQPITERGSKTYFDKYDYNTKIGKVLGNKRQGDGFLYRGRGYVQITGLTNYKKFSDILNIDLVKTPDLALKADVSWQIAVIGSTQGIFTGKKLSDYINANKKDFINARRVINGTDKAEIIARYADQFGIVLRASVLN